MRCKACNTRKAGWSHYCSECEPGVSEGNALRDAYALLDDLQGQYPSAQIRAAINRVGAPAAEEMDDIGRYERNSR